MSLIDKHPPHVTAPIIDRNLIKWSGYHSTSEQAEEHLKEQTKKIAITENKIIISANKDFVNRHFKGYFLYRFTVIVANKP